MGWTDLWTQAKEAVLGADSGDVTAPAGAGTPATTGPGSGETWLDRLTTCGLPFYLDGEMPIVGPPAGAYVATEFYGGQEHQEEYPCQEWWMLFYWEKDRKYNVTRYRNATSGEILWSASCSSSGTKADADAFQARHPELVVDYTKLAAGYTMDNEPANDALKHIDEIPDDVLAKSMPDVKDALDKGLVTKDYLKDLANKGAVVDFVDTDGTVVLKPKGYVKEPGKKYATAGFSPWPLLGVAAAVVAGVALYSKFGRKGKTKGRGRSTARRAARRPRRTAPRRGRRR